MSFERPYVLGENTDATDVLARVSWNLSQRLHLLAKREGIVSFHRSVTEKFGDHYKIGNGEDKKRYIQPIKQLTDIEFIADQTIDEDDGELTRAYTVRKVVTQDMTLDELPADVRKSLDALAEEEDSVISSLMEHRLHDLTMGDSLLQRRQGIDYVIDEDGDIYDFTLLVEFLLSDEVFHGNEYSPHATLSDEVVTPSSIAAESLEMYTPVDSQISLRSIRREVGRMKKFQANMDEFTILEQARAALEFGEEDQDRYARQAMSVIAILTSGFFKMRDLRRYPTDWS